MASSTKPEELMEVDSELISPDQKAASIPANDSCDFIMNTNKVLLDPSPADTPSRCQIKKDDSGISVEKSENSSEDDNSKKPKILQGKPLQDEGAASEDIVLENGAFPKLKNKTKNRNYRSKKVDKGIWEESSDEDECVGASIDKESPESGEKDNSNAVGQVGALDVNMAETSTSSLVATMTCDTTRGSSISSDSEDSNELLEGLKEKGDLSDAEEDNEAAEEVTPGVLLKSKPKHKWFVIQEVINRQTGVRGRCQGAELFQQRCYGSLHSVQRLELMYKLEEHSGCVNALHFNSSGRLLASGSDDLKIIVWDWAIGKYCMSYESGHRSNVFQAKFMPLTGDNHIVSCGRDGMVRLAELSSTGVCRSTRRLAQHRGPAHKISVHPETPHTLLSSGEDSLVLSLDIRDPKPNKLLNVKEGERKISLYSIHSNPLNSNEFCVSGRDNFIRVYDRRNVSSVAKKFCPQHLVRTAYALFTLKGGSLTSMDYTMTLSRKPHHSGIMQGDGGYVIAADVDEEEAMVDMSLLLMSTKRMAMVDMIIAADVDEEEAMVDMIIAADVDKEEGESTTGPFTHVTCAMYNYNGTEIIGSFNDEDIYLFDARGPDRGEYIHRYQGHRNNATVKGVNFFGSRSEYIVSGSDCGFIYFWEKETESIVQWMAGDENGVVNCLEPHPEIPVIATSGLDDDIKIWVPSCENEPTLDGLKSSVVANYKGREDDRQRDPEAFDGQMLWILWRHIRRSERRRNQASNPPGTPGPTTGRSSLPRAATVDPSEHSSNSSPTSSLASDDSDDAPNRVQCSPS
uniref:DDB1- and CUL4-associated factor 8 n=1 Tax=Timema poppense TaxID=170557 RepID=A0A7R9DFZ7_TIMPO|nr:unnamed protein product [Timema poppensis]